MMTAREIRSHFLTFFASKQHKIVSSAPIVNREDPTLMFTNAGMNQFKDFFLGNKIPDNPRIADTQKCLRVSGKHNDLEDVGYDGTHHTMFEMLGNWSIGDYFKKEAIDWSWELLTKVYGMNPSRLYATVFEGDANENIPPDIEAKQFWLKYLPENHILFGNKKDNFWEMGDTGPCGPCSEIHVDLRTEEEIEKCHGSLLVNKDHPKVVEIWNNVFIQFNRKADGSLAELPAMHVDTGMGFERLCMVLQGKTATYDTDIFTPFIEIIEKASGFTYTGSYNREAKQDIAMRVISDHIRAICFTIADGQLPANSGAGYVIRRILRRAVRYYYSFLNIKSPFLHTLVAPLAKAFDDVFPELMTQASQVARIIEMEETSFLHTLENGLKRFENISVKQGVISGNDAFELYDTFGFPIDLTRLIAEEKGLKIDEAAFEEALMKQKSRSRADAQKEVGDWINVLPDQPVTFTGYTDVEMQDANIIKYRTISIKKALQHQIVIDKSPFYGESGGQAGDQGILWIGDQPVKVLDTQKENDLILHIVDELPENPSLAVRGMIDKNRRLAISKNHTAAHLMHAAFHRIIGKHALQKGQDVDELKLRFDFSHFQKVSDEEILAIEKMVNEKIQANISLEERRSVPLAEAKTTGAMMLFGEKYGETVRIITFDKNYSVELCGGTHVAATGELGLFKIISESAIAAGIRRIEAVCGFEALKFIRQEKDELQEIRQILKGNQFPAKAIQQLLEENKSQKKVLEKFQQLQVQQLRDQLIHGATVGTDFSLIIQHIDIQDAALLKDLAFQIDNTLEKVVIVFTAKIQDKPQILVSISKSICNEKNLHAGNMVRTLAKNIDGGGGGQPFFATAGGKKIEGLNKVLEDAKKLFAS
jgi:alanyl-tRNA synthetase